MAEFEEMNAAGAGYEQNALDSADVARELGSVDADRTDADGVRRGITRRQAVCVLGVAGASVALGLAGCSSDGGSADEDPVVTDDTAASQDKAPTLSKSQQILQGMTIEEKVAQLFFVTPEELTGVDTATKAGDATAKALASIPVGGVVYFAKNITGKQQLEDMLAATVNYSKSAGLRIPVFTGVDEEGGTEVARIAKSGYFDVTKFPDMAEIGASGDTSKAAEVGTTIGTYLHEIGFSLDFAPDADVLTNPQNKVIGKRAFSSDADVCAEMVKAEVAAMLQTGTIPCAKHFPGHGNTAGDSHTGEAVTDRTADELNSCEYKPFSAAIEAGVPFIMIGHIKTPNATSDGLPATLSKEMITDVLRGQLGFSGVVISDSLSMGAITQEYTQADAAVKFLQAGGDMILMPEDLNAAYQGVLDAIDDGTLTEDRINESVVRVLDAKDTAGLLADFVTAEESEAQ